MWHKFLVISYETFLCALFALPRFPIFNWLKAKFLRCMGAKIGKRPIFYPGAWVAPGRNLEMGDDVDVALGVILITSGGLKIGSRVLIGYRAQINTSNHKIPSKSERIFNAGHDSKPIVIGDDVWIGGNSMIMAGVTIGEGAVVAGGAIVTRDVPAHAIVAGCPARIIRYRD